MPKSSAQVIGSHKVPQLTKPPPPKRTDGELGRMRDIFPGATAGEVGFHHDFDGERRRDAAAASQLMSGLSLKQVRGDPQLAAALRTLQGSVLRESRRFGFDGAQKGVKQREP